jgi:hypothetical protein
MPSPQVLIRSLPRDLRASARAPRVLAAPWSVVAAALAARYMRLEGGAPLAMALLRWPSGEHADPLAQLPAPAWPALRLAFTVLAAPLPAPAPAVATEAPPLLLALPASRVVPLPRLAMALSPQVRQRCGERSEAFTAHLERRTQRVEGGELAPAQRQPDRRELAPAQRQPDRRELAPAHTLPAPPPLPRVVRQGAAPTVAGAQPGRPAAAVPRATGGPVAPQAPPIDLGQLTEQVLRVIDRQVVAQRERQGR